jgi:endonuclease III
MTSVMKNPAMALKKLNALLRKLGSGSPPREAPPLDDPIATLVMSMLLWEATTDKALAGYQRLMNDAVDFNDLRVCMPHETIDLLGVRYPRVQERCQRLRAVLRSIYLREHAVSLDSLKNQGKREIKKYIDSLEGITPYAASRILLLTFDTHGIPVDDQLKALLVSAEVAEPDMETSEVAAWLSAQIKAEEAAATHHALQAWADKHASGGGGNRSASSRRSAGSPAGRH